MTVSACHLAPAGGSAEDAGAENKAVATGSLNDLERAPPGEGSETETLDVGKRVLFGVAGGSQGSAMARSTVTGCAQQQ